MSNKTTASTQRGIFRAASGAMIASAAIGLASCGGGGDQRNSPNGEGNSPNGEPFGQILTGESQAVWGGFHVTATRPGVTPFISLVDVSGTEIGNVAAVEFSIAPKPGSVSKPVHVHYSNAALSREGHLSTELVTVPVFGLYAGFANQVSVLLDFMDGSTATLPLVITTAPYTDPNGIYDHPTVFVPRTAGSALSFDFFVTKSDLGTPVIIDTDAEIRWVSVGVSDGSISALTDDGFVVGSPTTSTIYRLGFDGSVSSSTPPNAFWYEYHHNIDYGKEALLFEVNDYYSHGVQNLETTLLEMDPTGIVDHKWDLAQIVSSYMSSQGDDPTAFVRPGVDWFHMNSSTYDPSDDSVIVSSREDFLIKLDYTTGNIKWILGDPTKYWYTFPSLRAKALTLAPGGLYPIGQHSASITSDGLVMVMNDGLNSANQPAGEPAGERRTFSAVSAYSIDPVNRTAEEVWRFDYGQSILSPICGSSYEASGGSYLVDFATADNLTRARLVGLDSGHNVVFDFQYDSKPCGTSWNATPIALDNFAIL